MGMKLARGRDFDEHDREGAARIAVVNETMARRLWPGEDAIGKRFRIGTVGGDVGLDHDGRRAARCAAVGLERPAA